MLGRYLFFHLLHPELLIRHSKTSQTEEGAEIADVLGPSCLIFSSDTMASFAGDRIVQVDFTVRNATSLHENFYTVLSSCQLKKKIVKSSTSESINIKPN
jgi:hypothetical protein